MHFCKKLPIKSLFICYDFRKNRNSQPRNGIRHKQNFLLFSRSRCGNIHHFGGELRAFPRVISLASRCSALKYVMHVPETPFFRFMRGHFDIQSVFRSFPRLGKFVSRADFRYRFYCFSSLRRYSGNNSICPRGTRRTREFFVFPITKPGDFLAFRNG